MPNYYAIVYSGNELSHYGVPGMKWGVRKDGWNKGYSEDQRKRDLRIYGRGGVRRINKSMNKYGDSISGARSSEARRIGRARKASRVGGQIGTVAGGIAGFIAGQKISAKIPPEFRFQVAAGSAAVGTQLGRYGGQAIGMIAYGYSPDKFR